MQPHRLIQGVDTAPDGKMVPGHVVVLFLATGGQNGPGLGSDEKEVVLLVYVIIDVATESVSLSLHLLLVNDKH